MAPSTIAESRPPESSRTRPLELEARLRQAFSTIARNASASLPLSAEADAANTAGAQVVVKVDGDGQMNPVLIETIARPIVEGRADYAKGNRFHSIWNVRQMPRVRLVGNAALSFITKLSSGYWSIFDPTNGFTAIHVDALRRLELANVSERYFFESDMLINLGNIRAVVTDVPMVAAYGDETSNLRIGRVFGTFLAKNMRELSKRVLYNYFMRDFNLASAQLLLGTVMILFGAIFGALSWYESAATGETSTTGTVMLATLPIILGFQLILSFLEFDMGNEPKVPIQPGWPVRDRRALQASYEPDQTLLTPSAPAHDR